MVALTLAGAGCNLVSGLSDFDVAGGRGGGGAGGTGVGGEGVGGTGGDATLVDEGLIVRYFLDEAESGVAPTALDASGSGLDLSIDASANLVFAAEDGHRGLRWAIAESSGRASRDGVADGLDQGREVTFELVMALGGTSNFSRVIHVGAAAADGRLAVGLLGNALGLRINDSDAARWPYGDVARHVVHVCVDTGDADNARRARLFVDGVPREPNNSAPLEGVTFSIAPGTPFVLGNRGQEDRSPVGTLFYAAVYDRALDAEEIANNAALLAASDDTP